MTHRSPEKPEDVLLPSEEPARISQLVQNIQDIKRRLVEKKEILNELTMNICKRNTRELRTTRKRTAPCCAALRFYNSNANSNTNKLDTILTARPTVDSIVSPRSDTVR